MRATTRPSKPATQRPAAPTTISPGDRLGATLAFSLIAHGVLALGVGFTREDPAPIVPTLDVILTQTKGDKPDKADFLAQASQQGGGESEKAERPRETQLSRVPKPVPGDAPAQQAAATPRMERQHRQAVLTTTAPANDRISPEEHHPAPDSPLPSGHELIQQSLERMRLAAEIERQDINYAKRPKRKFVSASTQEFEMAAYLRAWVARVERIGNLNYPDEARRRNLKGQLMVTVAVRRDGTVERIDIIQPSGEPLLDETAVRIIRLAEPFAPLPETKENIDILHITRTWQFLPGTVRSDH